MKSIFMLCVAVSILGTAALMLFLLLFSYMTGNGLYILGSGMCFISLTVLSAVAGKMSKSEEY